jgi:hypothetical protein
MNNAKSKQRIFSFDVYNLRSVATRFVKLALERIQSIHSKTYSVNIT